MNGSLITPCPGYTRPLPGGARSPRPRIAWPLALVAAALLAVTHGSPVVTPARAESATEREAELEALRERIERLGRELEAARDERQDAREALREVEREIAALRVAADETRASLAATVADIARLEAERRHNREQLNAERASLSNLVEATYRMGRTEYVKLLLSQLDPAALDRALMYYRYLAQARRSRIDAVHARLERLDRIETELAERSRRLERLESRQQEELSRLAARGREREALIDELDRTLASGERRLAGLEADAARLEELVQELRRYLEEIGDIPPGASFAAMKGGLPLPVKTRIQARFGESRGGGGQSWEGLFLAGEGGEEVRAVFRGRVVYSGWFRGYGQLLIIDHGDGYMSLYGHNDRLFKEVGDGVETGEPIATLGATGGLRDPGLYFEIRQNGQPRDPLIWCKAS